jgi:hypothetical protein
MSSIYDTGDILKKYDLDNLLNKLKPIIGETITHLLNIYMIHFGKGSANSYRDFIYKSLRALLANYTDCQALFNKEVKERAEMALIVLISDLYDSARDYLSQKGWVV